MDKKPVFLLVLLITIIVAACRPETAVPTLVPKADIPASPSSQQEAERVILETVVVSEKELEEEYEIEEATGELPVYSEATTNTDNSTDPDVNTDSAPQEVSAESRGELEDFIGVEWNFVSYRNKDEEEITIESADSYRLQFNEDDTFVYQADCNQGSGGYQVSGDEITLSLGPVTLAVCPEGSQADQFIQLLRDVTSFVHQAPLLSLKLESGNGELLFLERVFATTESVELEIVGIEWQWSGFSDPAQGSLIVDDPENYKMALMPDGLIVVQADCNQGTGTYLLEESGLSISLDSVTNETCAAGSMWEQFIRYLNSAAIQFLQDDDLFIDLIYDSGTMHFVNSGPITG